MGGLGSGAAPTLVLMAAAAILVPDQAPGLIVVGSAMLLLLVSADLLVRMAGLPFLALGGLAVLGGGIAARLADAAGPWAAVLLAAAGGAAMLALAAGLLISSDRNVLAGTSLALTALAGTLPVRSMIMDLPSLAAAAVALTAAVAGLVLADRLGRSVLGSAVSPQRGATPARALRPLFAVAGLASSAAGALLAIGHAPSAWMLPQGAPAISVAAMAAAYVAGRGGLPATLLAGLPLLVAPAMALVLWPALPDLRLPLSALALIIVAARAVRRDTI